MVSRTLVCPGLLLIATTPHNVAVGNHANWFQFSSVSTTATSPQSCLAIISATCCILCSGVQ